MAAKEFSTDPQIIKITASDLEKGRRLMVVVIDDSINKNVTSHIEMEHHEQSGDFWISFGWAQ